MPTTSIYFVFQSTFMDSANKSAQAIEEIKQMMDRGSRFVSLSGWSGIAAGVCALLTAWLAGNKLSKYGVPGFESNEYATDTNTEPLVHELLILALITFVAAFFFAFLFTWLRSRNTGVPIWGLMARKVIFSLAVPMLVGALFIWRMIDLNMYELIAAACLLFYGLALVNASKFTLSEVRILGYLQILLGIIALWTPAYGLYLWAAGFGVLHILYGIVMWQKYERDEKGVTA
jgi:hypothetical protein